MKKFHEASDSDIHNLIIMANSIDSFDKHLKIKKIYGNHKVLKKYTKKYSAVFCGSDQAWLPSNIIHDFYTLSFAPIGVRRLAYAPSFGVSSIPSDMVKQYRDFLSCFDGISVREYSGASIVKELTGKNVPVVLDPTLLVGRNIWDKIKDHNLSLKYREYILVYLLGLSPKHRSFCEFISKKMNRNLVSLPHFIKYNKADEEMSGDKLYCVNPCQFLGLIKNAQLIITDSFHCSAFAMQYHRPYISLQRFKSNEAGSTNSRLYSLMEMFGMESRIAVDASEQEAIRILNDSIDFDKFDETLKEKQILSNKYLDNVMKGLI